MNSNFEDAKKSAVDNNVTEPKETKATPKAGKETKAVKKNVYQKLFAVQQSLKAHKGQHNDYGGYNYRSAEDILEAVKPFLAEQEAIILLNDEIFNIEGQKIVEKREIPKTIKDPAKNNELQIVIETSYTDKPMNYIKATATFLDIATGETINATAYAKECEHTGMSADQCSGCASSYSRKYALNALLCIDNTADSDSNEVAEKEKKANEQKSQAQGNGWNKSNGNSWGKNNNGWGK